MNRLFCGRTGTLPNGEDATRLATRMGHAMMGEAGGTVAVHSRDTAALAVAGHAEGRCLIRSESVLGAYSGSPYWTDPDYAALARDRGMAVSLAAAYERDGAGLLERLHGPFSIALVDHEKDETCLAIDRMGICEMHFAESSQGGLAFGNAQSALLAHGSCTSGIRDQAIFDYLYFHMVPAPATVYEKLFKLTAGECVTVRAGGVARHRYWSPAFPVSRGTDRHALESELHELLRQSVSRCLPEESAGCFLSGGIDSSTIAGILSELRPPAKTFTIGFREPGYDETSFARTAAEHFSTDHAEYLVSPRDVLDLATQIAAFSDEPFGNSSVVPAYFCARLAREHGIHTLLAGDGGDELFGGNLRYVTQQVFDLYDRIPRRLRTAVIEPAAFGIPGGHRFVLTRKLQSYIRQAKVPMPDRLETYNYLRRTPLDEIFHADFLDAVDVRSPGDQLRATYDSVDTASLLNRMLALDWKFTLADNDLRKVGSACELAGISVRYPFLDDELVEFSARVPPGLKIRHFRLRYFFKRAMRNFLPGRILRKSKHGFGMPFGLWLKSFPPLEELANDSLTSLGRRHIVREDYLGQLIDQHRSSHAHYYGEFIWVLMALELWLQRHEALRRTSASG